MYLADSTNFISFKDLIDLTIGNQSNLWLTIQIFILIIND
ncbi:hypothetical protein PCC8801_2686 [Rippkaea orientalis PCC 8801]|uniref:Uncharacterized protein n=1 Tax=Rippkaea orientalis (strain PCC 8801 / RF-1) TaxID=41431 RepID=B7K5F4_RIPO1|nr:hypothetical protein PCC8801_2686 [Rippkaea orientalis PCC 8801]